jgi:hypothetical protein
LSFAVVRLLDTLPPAFDPTRRYWVHFIFVVVAIWACAQYWWISWALASIEPWTYASFLLYLIPPAVLYSLARALGSPDPNSVESFFHHFQQIHRRFFALLATYMLVIILVGWLIGGLPLLHPARLFDPVLVIAALSGALITNPRYHAVLAAFFLLAAVLLTWGTVAGPAA